MKPSADVIDVNEEKQDATVISQTPAEVLQTLEDRICCDDLS